MNKLQFIKLFSQLPDNAEIGILDISKNKESRIRQLQPTKEGLYRQFEINKEEPTDEFTDQFTTAPLYLITFDSGLAPLVYKNLDSHAPPTDGNGMLIVRITFGDHIVYRMAVVRDGFLFDTLSGDLITGAGIAVQKLKIIFNNHVPNEAYAVLKSIKVEWTEVDKSGFQK